MGIQLKRLKKIKPGLIFVNKITVAESVQGFLEVGFHICSNNIVCPF